MKRGKRRHGEADREADREVGIWDRKVENGDVEVGVRNRHY